MLATNKLVDCQLTVRPVRVHAVDQRLLITAQPRGIDASLDTRFVEELAGVVLGESHVTKRGRAYSGRALRDCRNLEGDRLIATVLGPHADAEAVLHRKIGASQEATREERQERHHDAAKVQHTRPGGNKHDTLRNQRETVSAMAMICYAPKVIIDDNTIQVVCTEQVCTTHEAHSFTN